MDATFKKEKVFAGRTRDAVGSDPTETDQDEDPERTYEMYLENCILRYELHEMIERSWNVKTSNQISEYEHKR